MKSSINKATDRCLAWNCLSSALRAYLVTRSADSSKCLADNLYKIYSKGFYLSLQQSFNFSCLAQWANSATLGNCPLLKKKMHLQPMQVDAPKY